MFLRTENKPENLKLLNHYQRQLAAINETIVIHDIVALAANPEHAYGEAKGKKFDNTYQQPTLVRLIDHINLLAEVTNQYHLKYNYEMDENGIYQCKPNCSHRVTRLLMAEFFLYTQDPLTEEEFGVVVQAIHEIGKRQKSNVHLLLSSFAVLTKKNEVLNIAIYLQCGLDPKLEIISKTHSSVADINYGYSLFTQCPKKNPETEKIPRSIPTSQFITSHPEHNVVSNMSTFLVSVSGRVYIQTVELCVDNLASVGKKQCAHLISSHNGLLPSQGNHIVSSTVTELSDNTQITQSPIIHIDPEFGLVEIQENILQEDKMDEADFASLKLEPRYTLSFTKKPFGFVLSNPPFGSDIFILPQIPYRLYNLSPLLQIQVETHNRNYISQQLTVNTSKDHDTSRDEFNRDQDHQDIIKP